MFKDNEKKRKLMSQRKIHLEMMKAVLEIYKNNNQKYLIDFVKWLGGVSVSIKDELDKLEK